MADHFRIPKLCLNSSLLLVVLVTELTIAVIWLLGAYPNQWQSFGLLSFYAQWVVLGSCLSLCWLREWLARQNRMVGVLLSSIICFTVLLLVEFASTFVMTGEFGWLNWTQFWPIGLAGVIIIFAVLRFFMLLDKIEVRNKAEAESKIQALQSRIQPHFLFNSLNTIAELTAIDPSKAEQAIHALSMLFRIGLEEGNPTHALEKELSLCKRYQELEEFRLGDRATIMWIVEVEAPEKWQVPKLIVQPLLENAIKYSAQTGDQNDNSYVIVEIKETEQHLSILVENSVADQAEQSAGNGMAIENIQQRLFVLYDDQFSFRVRSQDNTYRVIMRIPK